MGHRRGLTTTTANSMFDIFKIRKDSIKTHISILRARGHHYSREPNLLVTRTQPLVPQAVTEVEFPIVFVFAE